MKHGGKPPVSDSITRVILTVPTCQQLIVFVISYTLSVVYGLAASGRVALFRLMRTVM